MKKHLHYYYPWHTLSDECFYRVIREFVDNSCNHFVITDMLLKNMLDNPDREKFMHKLCHDMQVEFSAVHGLDAKGFDMNTTDPDRWQGLIADHTKAMQIAAGFNCKSYVVHVGAAHYCYDHVPLDDLRKLALKTLERLLPEAEKLGLIIAVENSFEKPNSAKEVLGIVNHFRGTKAVGVCYDTGHANCMASAPGKDKSKYEPYFPVCWWENGVEWEDGAIQLLKEKIVTCHIHDNNGYGDLHGMPFDGTINWKELMQELFSCPNMIDFQTEVCYNSGDNWAGKLLAPEGGYSIRRVVDTFRYLGF